MGVGGGRQTMRVANLMNFRNLAANRCALRVVSMLWFLAACGMSFAGTQNPAPAQQTQPAAANGITGTPGAVLAQGVVNFADLARKEKLHPPKRASQKSVRHR